MGTAAHGLYIGYLCGELADLGRTSGGAEVVMSVFCGY